MSRFQLSTIITIVLLSLSVSVSRLSAQVYDYGIYYHYSFLDDMAAQATVEVNEDGGAFYATLAGCSVPILNVKYCINDTLVSRFADQGIATRPAQEYVEKLSGYYRKPHEGHPENPDLPSSYVNIYGQGELSADAATMECVNLTADMLCIFYYAKTIDFGSLPEYDPVYVTINMPNGEQRTLQIASHGRTEWEGRPAYKLVVNFTYEGTMSRYPITTLIDEAWRIPVSFAASIAIGHVEMKYQP